MTYDPSQPRVGKGHPDGGQWTSDGGGAAKSARESAGLKTPMEYFEDKNRLLPYERLGAFDKDSGELFFTKNGTEKQIQLDENEKMYLRGADITHNHPGEGIRGNYLLSPGDISTALACGFKSIKSYNEYGWAKIILSDNYFKKEAPGRFMSAQMFNDFFNRVSGQIFNEMHLKHGSPLTYEIIEEALIQTYKRAELYYDFTFEYERYNQ